VWTSRVAKVLPVVCLGAVCLVPHWGTGQKKRVTGFGLPVNVKKSCQALLACAAVILWTFTEFLRGLAGGRPCVQIQTVVLSLDPIESYVLFSHERRFVDGLIYCENVDADCDISCWCCFLSSCGCVF
jgi:hypothetical protein